MKGKINKIFEEKEMKGNKEATNREYQSLCFKLAFSLLQQILNSRDSSANNYVDYNLDWKNFASYLPNFICG